MDKPKYAFWAAQPDYDLVQVAFLCCDLQPVLVSKEAPMPPEVGATLGRLMKEVDYALDPAIPTRFPRVQREDLRQWAEATGQRAAMPFLFPEDWEPEAPAKRTDPKAIEPGQVTEREEPSVLEILGAIIKAKYGPDFVPDLVSDRSTKIGIIQRDVERYIPSIDPKTLRKYLKRLPL